MIDSSLRVSQRTLRILGELPQTDVATVTQILQAMARHSDRLLTDVFEHTDVDPSQIEARADVSLASHPVTVRSLLQRAERLRNEHQQAEIEPEHLLLALVDISDEEPWNALRIDRAHIHDATLEQVKRPRLTHLNDRGQARMVDVGAKSDTAREAIARGMVVMQPETLRLIEDGELAKGDVLATARIAGIMAAKQTSALIPLCHPLMLSHVSVLLTPDADNSAVQIEAIVRTTGKTGVEMEALTAVSVAALTIYDMCKAVDRGMQLMDIRLARKSGGKSGDIILE